jgi:hypothetical protein
MSYKSYDANGEEERESVLVNPTDEVRQKMLHGNTCGTCKYFSLHEGQRLIETQRFLATLVKEHRWQPHHLGAPPETLGDCGAHRSGSRGDETMLTGPLHVACDQWRKR